VSTLEWDGRFILSGAEVELAQVFTVFPVSLQLVGWSEISNFWVAEVKTRGIGKEMKKTNPVEGVSASREAKSGELDSLGD